MDNLENNEILNGVRSGVASASNGYQNLNDARGEFVAQARENVVGAVSGVAQNAGEVVRGAANNAVNSAQAAVFAGLNGSGVAQNVAGGAQGLVQDAVEGTSNIGGAVQNVAQGMVSGVNENIAGVAQGGVDFAQNQAENVARPVGSLAQNFDAALHGAGVAQVAANTPSFEAQNQVVAPNFEVAESTVSSMGATQQPEIAESFENTLQTGKVISPISNNIEVEASSEIEKELAQVSTESESESEVESEQNIEVSPAPVVATVPVVSKKAQALERWSIFLGYGTFPILASLTILMAFLAVRSFLADFSNILTIGSAVATLSLWPIIMMAGSILIPLTGFFLGRAYEKKTGDVSTGKILSIVSFLVVGTVAGLSFWGFVETQQAAKEKATQSQQENRLFIPLIDSGVED